MSRVQALKTELSSLKLSAEYWDVRIEESFETLLVFNDGEVTTCSVNPSLGAFLRVRKDGFWLLESTTDLSGLEAILKRLDATPVPHGGNRRYMATRQEPDFTLRG